MFKTNYLNYRYRRNWPVALKNKKETIKEYISYSFWVIVVANWGSKIGKWLASNKFVIKRKFSIIIMIITFLIRNNLKQFKININ